MATPTTGKNIDSPALHLQSKSPQTKPIMRAPFSYSYHLPLAINAGKFTLNTFALGFNVVHLKSQTVVSSRENQHWLQPQFCSLSCPFYSLRFLCQHQRKENSFSFPSLFSRPYKGPRTRITQNSVGCQAEIENSFTSKHRAIQEQRTKESQPTGTKLGDWHKKR